MSLPNDPAGIYDLARREGCIGPPHLTIALSVLLALSLLRAAILGPRKTL